MKKNLVAQPELLLLIEYSEKYAAVNKRKIIFKTWLIALDSQMEKLFFNKLNLSFVWRIVRD